MKSLLWTQRLVFSISFNTSLLVIPGSLLEISNGSFLGLGGSASAGEARPNTNARYNALKKTIVANTRLQTLAAMGAVYSNDCGADQCGP